MQLLNSALPKPLQPSCFHYLQHMQFVASSELPGFIGAHFYSVYARLFLLHKPDSKVLLHLVYFDEISRSELLSVLNLMVVRFILTLQPARPLNHVIAVE